MMGIVPGVPKNCPRKVARPDGGVLMQAGPLQVDLGYRYKKIVANSVLSNVIGVGQDMQSHQVRFGAGVRF